MPFATTTIIAVAGIATAAAAGVQQSRAQRQASDASQRGEDIRAQQLELENTRRQRALLRQAQAASAQSLATATARGVAQSDIAPGAIGQIESQLGQNLLAQSENTALSRGIFDANRDIAEAKADAAEAGAIGDFGKTLFANSDKLGAIGSNIAGKQI